MPLVDVLDEGSLPEMTLTVGAKLGRYEITGALGAGGMGEVEPFWRRLSRQAKSRTVFARDLFLRDLLC